MHIIQCVYKFLNNNSSSSTRIRILELELYTMNVHLGTHRIGAKYLDLVLQYYSVGM